MERPIYKCKSFDDFINGPLTDSKGYLEKANISDLGDWTEEGKTRNAGYNNFTVYWDWYKKDGYGGYQGEPYCACGVCETAVAGFGLEVAKEIFCGRLFIYCPDGYNQFKAKGRILNTPKKGAVVFFWSESLGRYSHTGWVIGVDSNGTGFTTWEANTSSGNDCVVRNGGATVFKHYKSSTSAKFGMPDWAALGIAINNEEEIKPKYTTYKIGTFGLGIECTSDVGPVNVRSGPGKAYGVVNNIGKGEFVVPTLKSFIDGKAWYYIESKGGWCSASYFKGWIQEFSDDGKWWYLLPGYKYYVNQIVTIDNKQYFFGSDGYMFIGTITLTTDPSGALKIDINRL